MLHRQRIRAPLFAFRTLHCVEPRPRWNGQNGPSHLWRDDAAFSTRSSARMPHEQPTRIPYLHISIAHVRTSCVQRFTTARDYSSQAAEALESTPFIGDVDAAFLQRMIALGSSASKASDLAPLNEQLAIPNVPITMKTIGAKVIVAALEQRQQWALLPALLPIPEVRRLAQDQKLDVGEQLFAALLRGQFEFASRHNGTAPDVFRTLDLAAKCNALHAPAVIEAVRAGYRALGLESPTRITDLLDIGPTDPASSQHRTQQREHDNNADDPTSIGPIGSSMGRLTGGRFVSQIVLARKTQSVYAVLPAVLAALPRIDDLARERVLGAVCGREVYTVSEVQGLARALGTVPNAPVWSQVTTNAIHNSGPTDAAAIIQHVYDHVPDGYVAYRAMHQVISTLVGQDHLVLPTREAVQLALKLFELHRTKGGDRTFHLRPSSEVSGTLVPLILALMADINIPEREAAIEMLCQYMEAKKLLSGSEEFGETSAGTIARLAAVRCTSHLDALEAALAEPGGSLTDGDLRGSFGFIIQFRYADATVAPIAVLLRTLDFARDRGFLLDQFYAWIYVRGIAKSILRLRADLGAGLRPVKRSGKSDGTVPEQHMSQALAAIRQAESLCYDPDRSFTYDNLLVTMIVFAYTVHGGAPDDCIRLRSGLLSTANKRADSSASKASAFLLIRGADTYKELREIWSKISSEGTPQSVGMGCHYAKKLLRFHRFHMAIEYARRHIPDDPTEPDIVLFVARLLLATENTELRLAARAVLPITANDARTREAINTVIAHRKRLGLKQQTMMPDI